MSVRRCSIGAELGWKWGEDGRCHIGEGALERAEADKAHDINTGSFDSRNTDLIPSETQNTDRYNRNKRRK